LAGQLTVETWLREAAGFGAGFLGTREDNL